MKRHVLQAKAQGLRNIRAKVVVGDTATLMDDKYATWSRQAISSQWEQNLATVKAVDRLVGGNTEVIQHQLHLGLEGCPFRYQGSSKCRCSSGQPLKDASWRPPPFSHKHNQ